jgi:putative transposase
MQYYRMTSHTKFDNKYHLVWITKYRKKILKGEIGVRCRDIIRQICEKFEVDIIRGNIAPDYIHILVSIPPQYSVSKVVQNLKRKTSRKLQEEFRELRKEYWGRHFWAIGYFSVTSGNITDEMIIKYIEEQGKQREDDIFQITPN